MIVVSFGSPSAISYTVVNILRNLLTQYDKTCAVLQVIDLAEFEVQRQETSAEGKSTVVVVSDCPRADLVALFATADQPVLVCCEPFDVVVRYNMRSRGMAFAPALRFATQVLSALDALAGVPHVLRIDHRRYGDPLRAVVDLIAAFIGLDPMNDWVDAAVRHVDEGTEFSSTTFQEYVVQSFPHASEINGPALPEREGALLRDLGRHYGPLVEGETLRAVEWPARLLLDWDHPGRFLEGAVPLLGPARFVVCGPYLHLPAGRWRMTVGFETHDCWSDNRIQADVFDGCILAAVAVLLPKEGRYEFTMDFPVTDPLRPLELRIRLATGAIEGSLDLLNLRLQCLDRARHSDASLQARTREAT